MIFRAALGSGLSPALAASHSDSAVSTALAQIAREADQRGGSARQAIAVDNDLVAEEPDDDGRRRLERFGRGGIQRVDAALHERGVRRIEVGAPQRCREPPYQFLGLLDMQVSFGGAR